MSEYTELVDRLRAFHAGETKHIATLADAVDAIESLECELRELREKEKEEITILKARLRALARFTWHVYGCDHLEGGPKCDCGLDDLIQQLRKEGLVE